MEYICQASWKIQCVLRGVLIQLRTLTSNYIHIGKVVFAKRANQRQRATNTGTTKLKRFTKGEVQNSFYLRRWCISENALASIFQLQVA